VYNLHENSENAGSNLHKSSIIGISSSLFNM